MDAAANESNQFLIIIGAAKCGTTSLFDYLSEHPAICPSNPKENGFFSEYQKKDENWQYLRDIDRYEDFWPSFDPRVHRYRLEASTSYTRWPLEDGVAQRMQKYGIRPRLIYVVRDPIERIESDVNRRRIVNHKPYTFDHPFFVDISRYATQLDPFVATFGRESIRVIDFVQLCSEPDEVCASIYGWLNLEIRAIQNPGISNETASMKWSHAERIVFGNHLLHTTAQKFPRGIRRQVKRITRKLVPYRHTRQRMSSERAREIRLVLQEDMDRLSREWGIDVARWGF
ncbi:sulfotransferase [Mycolicibacterium elephantis]